MKKNILSVSLLFITVYSYCQVNALKIEKVERPDNSVEYDELLVFESLGVIDHVSENKEEDKEVDKKWKFLFKEGNKTKIIENKFRGRNYAVYYGNRYYIGGKNGLDEDYNLAMAIKALEIKRGLISLRQSELDTLLKNMTIDGADDQEALDRKREEVYSKFAQKIEKSHKKSVEYFFKYRNTRNLSFGIGTGRDKALRTSLFFEQNVDGKEDRFLNNYGLNWGLDGTPSVNSELFKDYFPFVRFSIGTVVSSNVTVEDTNIVNNTELKEETLQRIISGGGNFVGTISTPILHGYSNVEGALRFLMTGNIRSAIDVPKLGTIQNDVNFMINPYINTSLIYGGYSGDIALLVDFSMGYLVAGKQYYDYLNISDDSRIREKGMFVHKIEAGLAFGKLFRVTYSHMFGNEYWKGENVSKVSFTFVPN